MSTLDPSIDESHRIDYLFECMRTTREEMLFRIKHRDNWLSAHLVVQAGLLALAQGVEMAGLKGSESLSRRVGARSTYCLYPCLPLLRRRPSY